MESDMRKHSNTANQNATEAPDNTTDGVDDMIVVLEPKLGAYVQQLITSDLEHGIAAIVSDVEEGATALAMYLHDSLPAVLRTPVPVLRYTR
jgi:hypothetical protein